MAKYKHLQKAAKAGGAKSSSTVAMSVLHDKAKAVAGGPVPPQQIQDPAAAPMTPEQRRVQLSHISYRPNRNIVPIQKAQKPTIGPVEG
jgi:hypothetical protein